MWRESECAARAGEKGHTAVPRRMRTAVSHTRRLSCAYRLQRTRTLYYMYCTTCTVLHVHVHVHVRGTIERRRNGGCVVRTGLGGPPRNFFAQTLLNARKLITHKLTRPHSVSTHEICHQKHALPEYGNGSCSSAEMAYSVRDQSHMTMPREQPRGST